MIAMPGVASKVRHMWLVAHLRAPHLKRLWLQWFTSIGIKFQLPLSRLLDVANQSCS